MCGFIKLRRSLSGWEWYSDHNATRLLVHLLISVNYKEKKWKGVTIKKGSMVFSWETLSGQCGLTVQQCRTAMKKLIDSNEVTKQSTNKYQMLTLVKWDKIQLGEKNLTGNVTNKQQSNNKQVTTTKESKEYKEGKEKVMSSKLDYDKLLIFLNDKTGRSFKTVNQKIRAKFSARLKEGYTKENIMSAIQNAIKQKNHIENGNQYLTPEFFSRSDTLDKYGTKPAENPNESKDGLRVGDSFQGKEIMFFTDKGIPVLKPNTSKPSKNFQK